MVDLAELWMRKFEDQGPLLDVRGNQIRGSDPELLQGDNGRYYRFGTFGPTHPAAPGGSSPGIYVNVSDDLRTGYTRSERTNLVPDRSRGERGIETFCATWLDSAGLYYGLITVYEERGRNDRIVPVVSRPSQFPGVWSRLDEDAVWPRYEWEQGRFGENGIVALRRQLLVSSYSGKSAEPRTQWSTGWMASLDGRRWDRQPWPFARPPHYFEDGKGINSHSHSTIAEDPEHDDYIHVITTESGNVGPDKKGLVQWLFDPTDLRWHKREGFLVQPSDVAQMSHIGGPSLFRHDGRWAMVIHADARDRGIKRHSRLLVEKKP